MGGRVGVVPTGLLVLLGLWVLLGVWVVDIIGGEGGNMGPLGEGKEKLLPGGNVLGFTSTTEKKKIIHYVSLKLLCASVNDFMKNESLNMVPCLSDK